MLLFYYVCLYTLQTQREMEKGEADKVTGSTECKRKNVEAKTGLAQ